MIRENSPQVPFVDTQEELLEIGTIVAPQGLKGQLRVKTSSDFPERFEKPGKRWLKCQTSLTPEEVELLSGYQVPGKDIYIVQLAEITDREKAEKLRGCKLLVSSSDRPSLEVDEYHVADLINLEVYHQLTGEKIGIVTNVLMAGNDLLEVKLVEDFLKNAQIKRSDSSKPIKVLIPFVKEIVPIVNLSGGRLEINPPAGLLEV